MKNMRRVLSLLLAAALLVSVTSAAFAEDYWSKTGSPVKLKYWVQLSAAASSVLNNYSESFMYQKIMDESDLEFTFIHPAAGGEVTAFNLMIVSGDLPDIIEYDWSKYPGGPQKAIDDGIIISLNDVIQEYAPDAYAVMTETENIYRQCTTDSGVFYGFVPVVKSDTIPNGNTIDKVQSGPIIRVDWLNELGLSVPLTIDEWTEALTAFKDIKGAEAPLSFQGTAGFEPFAGAFDVGTGYYLENGVVTYGPIQDNYREFLKQMNQWYTAGLLDPDFATTDSTTQKSNLLNGVSGAFVGPSGSGVAQTNTNGKALDPDFEVAGVPYPVTEEGQTARFAGYSYETRTYNTAAITTACENVEEAAKLLNYFYTDEGALLKNFGIEGESFYREADGSVYYTDYLLNNPDGLSLKQAQTLYCRTDTPAPGLIIKAMTPTPDTNAALETWYAIARDVLQTSYPAFASQTSEEADELSMITPNIDAYQTEMFVKFVMGTADIHTQWDEYVSYVNTLGIERVVELKQQAINRYINK